jgi:septal ring factor EnvC (AmiA/AmiB activator)
MARPWLLLAALLLLPSAADGQVDEVRRQIQESQRRLEEVRAERERLQDEMRALTGRVRSVSDELQNIERQLSASRSALAEVDFQVGTISSQIQSNTGDLIITRERLREGTAILYRRLRDIYKRGALSVAKVLLGADSFSDLLTRYRYLRMIASYDRALVERVSELEVDLLAQDDDLQGAMAELGRLRQQRLGEVAQLRSVEAERRSALDAFRAQERRTTNRLEELSSDETRMAQLVMNLEARRLELEARNASGAGPATLGSGDAGDLPWPVDGELVYSFGPARQPNGTVLRWNGIGIRASRGTPVRAVRSGVVVLAGPFEGYGPTVVLSHGEGFYTLYLYLEEIGVVQGRSVSAGQVVGTVGGSDTPEGAHVEFQIRAPNQNGSPEATDPLRWLRARGG